jgi:sulfate permease, SulP family
MKNHEFTPKLFTLLKAGITKQQLSKEIMAGIIVGIVALPLAIAFAIASGVSPEKGLITAVIAGLTVSVLGGSRVQIAGPTGAFIVIVYAIVQDHGVSGLIIATFMAGFLLIGMGLARLGNYLKFIPYPLIVGFTSGIAVIIFTSQIKDLFGLPIENLPADFVQKWVAYGQNHSMINIYALAIGAGTMLVATLFHKITRRVPGTIVAIVSTTFIVFYAGIPVETIGSRFGSIPNTFPLPTLPDIQFSTIQSLIQPAIAIALLGAIESLLSAVVADGMTGGRHRSNMELIAQGSANILSGLFGGIPATGAIARTATNVRSGGRTPIAGIVHAIVLLLIMLLLAPLAKHIPMACLAGILIIVAWRMGEWRHFISLIRSNKMDVLILLTTFLLTVFFDLIIAIQVGVILSSFFFMKRMSEATAVKSTNSILGDAVDEGVLFEEELPNIPAGVMMYEVHGPLFFGASRKFDEAISEIHERTEFLILRMRNVPFVDATGIRNLQELTTSMKVRKVTIIISGANREVRKALLHGGLYETIGKQNIHSNITSALTHVTEIMNEKGLNVY